MISVILRNKLLLAVELMGYLRNKLLLVSLWAFYGSFNIQHSLVFQQILDIFPQKDSVWLWFPDGFY